MVGEETGALGTDHLSGAKRSRREDEGPVPMAGGTAKRGQGLGVRGRKGERGKWKAESGKLKKVRREGGGVRRFRADARL